MHVIVDAVGTVAVVEMVDAVSQLYMVVVSGDGISYS